MIKTVKYGDVTTTPKDYECPDGDLEVCMNGSVEEESIQPILPSRKLITMGEDGKALYVHKVDGHVNIIGYTKPWLLYYDETGTRHLIDSPDLHPDTICAVGNVVKLTDLTDRKMYSLIWTGTDYKCLDGHLPEAKIRFTTSMHFGDDGSLSYNSMDDIGMASPVKDINLGITMPSGGGAVSIPADIQEKATDTAHACFNLVNASRKSMGLFQYAHLVRTALVLYNGEYAMYSTPVLIHGRGSHQSVIYRNQKMFSTIYPYMLDYYISNMQEILKWKDIVKGIAFFISQEITDWDQNGQATEAIYNSSTGDARIDMSFPASVVTEKTKNAFTFYKVGEVNIEDYVNGYSYINIYGNTDANGRKVPMSDGSLIINLKPRDDRGTISKTISISSADTLDSIWNKTEQAFADTELTLSKAYITNRNDSDNVSFESSLRILFIGKVPMSIISASVSFTASVKPVLISYKDAGGMPLMPDKTPMASLEQQRSITDDYMSHNAIVASGMHSFNGRIVYTGIQRWYWSPSLASLGNWYSTPRYNIDAAWYVLKKDGNDITVNADTTETDIHSYLNYLYYPDTRCYKAIVRISDKQTHRTQYLNLPMESSDFLNGSIFCAGVPREENGMTVNTDIMRYVDNSITSDPEETYYPENLPNSVVASNAGSPYTWDADGWLTAGNGKVLTISSITTALSQGQFGEYGLYVFCSDGVWSIPVDRQTGKFDTPAATTRDVITNVNSVCQIDNAVLFATARGIMLLNAQTSVCISETIDSRKFDISKLPGYSRLIELTGLDASLFQWEEFQEYLKHCRSVYDYINQRVVIFNRSTSYAYVYNLKYKKWSFVQCNYATALNSYPEAYVVTTSLTVENISEKDPSFDESSQSVPVFILTRPLKFDMNDILKTVRRIYQRGMFRSTSIKQVLYASRDLIHWAAIGLTTDGRMDSISGTGYKYFRLAVICKLMADESLYGFTVEFEPKYINKLR